MDRLEDLYAHVTPSAAHAAAAAIAHELAALGADVAFVATYAHGGLTLEVARVTRFSDHPVALAFPVDAPYPLAVAMRDNKRLFIADNAQLRCDHPGLVRVRGEDHACATVPLLDEDGSVLGALNLGFEDPHEFTPAERRRIERLAQRCAVALRREQRVQPPQGDVRARLDGAER